METIVVNIGMGLLQGIIAAAIGYFANLKLEPFDIQKFTKMLIIGTIIGGIVGISGVDFDTSLDILSAKIGVPEEVLSIGIMTGVTMLAEKLISLIWRRSLDIKNYLSPESPPCDPTTPVTETPVITP
jgi:hypothetical protein